MIKLKYYIMNKKGLFLHLFAFIAFFSLSATGQDLGPETLYLIGEYNNKTWSSNPIDSDTPKFSTTDGVTYTLEIEITGGKDQWNPDPKLYLCDNDGVSYGTWGESKNDVINLFGGKNGAFTVDAGYKYKIKAKYTKIANPYNSSLLETGFEVTKEIISDLGGGDIVDDGTHKSIHLDYTYNSLPDRKLAITPDTEITFDGRYMYITNSTGKYMNTLDNLGGFSISSDPGVQLSEITTGINTPITDTLHVLNTGSAVEVTGASAGTEIYLFNINGATVAHATQGNTEDATVLATGTLTPGIYILTVGNKSFKLAIR